MVQLAGACLVQSCLLLLLLLARPSPSGGDPAASCGLHRKVIFALNQTLLQQESLRAGSLQTPYTTEDLIEHYNCGDLNSIIFSHDTSQVPNFINATLPPKERVTAQEIDSYFRQELVYKRNERMGKRVKDLLEENPDKSFFFAFGAGHFMGNNTVIDVLGREGYEVEHTPAGQPINNTTDPPPRIRIINGYITVEPQPRGHGRSSHLHTETSRAHMPVHSLLILLLTRALQTLTMLQ